MPPPGSSRITLLGSHVTSAFPSSHPPHGRHGTSARCLRSGQRFHAGQENVSVPWHDVQGPPPSNSGHVWDHVSKPPWSPPASRCSGTSALSHVLGSAATSGIAVIMGKHSLLLRGASWVLPFNPSAALAPKNPGKKRLDLRQNEVIQGMYEKARSGAS